MNHWETSRVIELLCESSKIAFSFVNGKHVEIKKDKTLVTAADKAVEDFLTSELEDESSGSYLIGEETYSKRSGAYLDSALKGTSWIIDPIDGTALYAHDIPLWGTSIGFSENGMLLEGGVIVPYTGELLISENGRTYYTRDVKTLSARDFRAALTELEPPAREFGLGDIIGLSQRAARKWTTDIPNTVNSFCTTVYENILVATGRHYATMTCAKLWDHAGTIPAMRNLGFASASFNSGGDMMTGEVSERVYDLDYTSVSAFALLDMTMICPDKETCGALLTRFKH